MKKKKNNTITCRLFIDMDGTLNFFDKNIDSIDVIYSKGYFSNLKPIKQVVNAIKEFLKHDNEVYILTNVIDSPYAIYEKNKWIDKYLPEIDSNHRIFVPYGKNKINFISNGIQHTDFLLDDSDDYLNEWSKKGTAIKLVNNLNDKGKWQGEEIYYNDYYLSIAYSLKSIQNKSILKGIMEHEDYFYDILNNDKH